MDIKNLGPDSPDDDPDENLETDQYPDPNKSKAEGWGIKFDFCTKKKQVDNHHQGPRLF